MGADKARHQDVIHVAQSQWCFGICTSQNRVTFRRPPGDAKHNLSVQLRLQERSCCRRWLPGRQCCMEHRPGVYLEYREVIGLDGLQLLRLQFCRRLQMTSKL